MELSSPDIAPPHSAGHRHIAVLGGSQRAVRAISGVKAVDIVDVFAVPEIFEQGIVLYDVQAVPAHVGDLQRRIGQAAPQICHLTGNQPQTGVLSVFKAAVKQQLHSKADA